MSRNTSQNRRKQRRVLMAAAAVKPVTRDISFGGPVVITAAAASAGDKPKPKIDIVAYNGGELLVDGFDLPVVIDLAGAEIPETLPLNIDHNQGFHFLLGQGQTTVSGNSLVISGRITSQNPNAQEVVRAALEDGFKWQASVKAIIHASREIPEGQRFTANGRTFTGPMIHAITSQVTHCAVLGEGADQTSTVSIAAKSKAAKVLKGSIMTFEQWLASMGLDPATLSAEATAVLRTQFDATQASAAAPAAEAGAVKAEAGAMPEEEKQVPQAAAASAASRSASVLLAAVRKAQADEVRRVAEIRAKAKGFPLIEAKAIEEGWTADKTELEVYKQDRGTGPAIHVKTFDGSPKVLEAAFCQGGKLRNIEKHFDAKTLDTAYTQYRGAVSMQRVLIEAAMRNGEHVPPGRLAASSLSRVLRAAFSTGDLSGTLSNVANKFLLDGYNSTAGMEKARKISGTPKSVADFKENKSFRMIDGGDFEELSPTGKIANGTLSEESFTNQAKTRAKMYKITRTDLINDDLGTFDQLRAMIGMGSARTFLKGFWTEFLADLATFYTAARLNYQEGAATALSSAGLTTALTLFRKQQTPQGTDLDLEPKYLLCPPELEGTADELYTSRTLVYGGASASKQPSDNTHAGKYEPVVVSQLSNSNITGYSTKHWWLLPEPMVGMRVIEVCYLDGVESPTVETSDADFDELGIQMRGYLDYGFRKQEYKAAVRSKGEV